MTPAPQFMSVSCVHLLVSFFPLLCVCSNPSI